MESPSARAKESHSAGDSGESTLMRTCGVTQPVVGERESRAPARHDLNSRGRSRSAAL